MDSIICHSGPLSCTNFTQNTCFPHHLLLSSRRRPSSLLPVDNRSCTESFSFLGLRKSSYLMASGTLTANPAPPRGVIYTVGDFMTGKEYLHAVKPTTTVEEALELLVENRITGFPVIEDDWKLVGLVSDYDLLALDSISGGGSRSNSMFPEVDSSWKTFNEVQRLLSKTNGKVVGELMTPAPLVVRETTNLEDATRLLLETKYRRLPVVDAEGKLVGIITRGDVVRAALRIKRGNEAKG